MKIFEFLNPFRNRSKSGETNNEINSKIAGLEQDKKSIGNFMTSADNTGTSKGADLKRLSSINASLESLRAKLPSSPIETGKLVGALSKPISADSSFVGQTTGEENTTSTDRSA